MVCCPYDIDVLVDGTVIDSEVRYPFALIQKLCRFRSL